jgi:O-antigen/teichoic acid export membrane protein
MISIFTALSNMSVSNRQKFDHSIYKGALVIIAFGSILAFLLTLISPFFIPLFFGNNYLPSIKAFNYLIWFGVIYSVDVLLGNALSSSDNQNILAIIAVIDLLIALPIFYYSSYYGTTFLAMSRLLVGFITLSYHLFIFKKLLKSNFKILEWAFLLIFLVIMLSLSLQSVLYRASIKIFIAFLITIFFILIRVTNFWKIPMLIKNLSK